MKQTRLPGRSIARNNKAGLVGVQPLPGGKWGWSTGCPHKLPPLPGLLQESVLATTLARGAVKDFENCARNLLCYNYVKIVAD